MTYNLNNKQIMAKKQTKHLNSKQMAYEKKQEAEGRKVVNWIFGVLIVAAICYLIWIATMMG